MKESWRYTVNALIERANEHREMLQFDLDKTVFILD